MHAVFGEVVRIRRGPLYSVLKDLVKGTSFEGTQLWMKRGGMDAPTVLMNEEQVGLIGPEHPFNQGAEIEALRFGLSRELMYLRPDSILLKKFSSQSLLGILTALWVALGGSEEADAWPRESLESWVVAFRKLGAEEREKLRGSLESVRLVLEYPDRLSEYADWLEKAAGRAAYLCCGSRGAATHSIEMGMETTNGLPIHTLKRDLVLYSMLPDHK